jgi:hypothetical protein
MPSGYVFDCSGSNPGKGKRCFFAPQRLFQCISGIISLELMRRKLEADLMSPYSAEFKGLCTCTSNSPLRLHGAGTTSPFNFTTQGVSLYSVFDGFIIPVSPQKLMLTSPTSDGSSVGIVPSRTKATVLSSQFLLCIPGCL